MISFFLIPYQVKDRQKKKRLVKGVRVTVDGDATLENLDQDGPRYDEPVSGLEKGATTNKKVFLYLVGHTSYS